MGIPVGTMTVRIYTLSGLLSGLAGIVFSFYTASGYSLSAVGVELDTIAAVVIGGTLLTGGQGSVIGTFLGVLIQGLIQTYITFDGTLSSWWTKIVTGVLLLAFIALQQDDDHGCAALRRPGRSQAMTSLIVIPTRRSHSNHAEVARSIGVDIIAGRYAEGVRLPGDAELTATFGVSRPVLRESVKTLVAKGLLTTKARVGTVVRERGAWNMFDADVLAWHLDAGIDIRFLGDLAEIRLAVEPRAARLGGGPALRGGCRRTAAQHGQDAPRAIRFGRFRGRRPFAPHHRRESVRKPVHAIDRPRDRGRIARLVPAQRAGRARGSRGRTVLAPAHRRRHRRPRWRDGRRRHGRGDSQRHAAI